MVTVWLLMDHKSALGPDERSRPIRLPTFVPPDLRPLLEAALSEAAREPAADAVRIMARCFRHPPQMAALPDDVAPPHPWADDERKRIERVVGAILEQWREAPDTADKVEVRLPESSRRPLRFIFSTPR